MKGSRAVKASVILAHPYPKSLNHAIFQAAADELRKLGAEVYAHDLYAERFDPVLTVGELGKRPTRSKLVRRYAEELVASDILVFVHPNWWGQPPAMMKGYIDRVVRPPHAYDFPDDDPGGLATGKLAGKIGVVLNTSNTPAGREDSYFGDPLESEWARCVFGFCGIERSYRKMFRVVSESSPEQRAAWLAEARALVGRAVSEARA